MKCPMVTWIPAFSWRSERDHPPAGQGYRQRSGRRPDQVRGKPSMLTHFVAMVGSPLTAARVVRVTSQRSEVS
jgi:hypothetical protein